MRALAVIAVSVVLVACSEQVDEAYPTLAEAVAAGAIERGWLPSWLPDSSKDILESHDLDTNVSALSLHFSEGQSWAPPASCKQVPPTSVPRAIGGRSWPPDVPPSGPTTHRHSYFSCEDGEGFLAVSTTQGELYYWRPNGI